MKVEIRHNVDRVLDQVYNFLTYDFFISDGRIRARSYVDTISEVSILARLNLDGSPPAAVQALQFGAPSEGQTEEAAQAALAALDPRSSAQFEAVLDYLRDRFSTIQTLGPNGYETIATGFNEDELAQRAARDRRDGFHQTVVVDIDLDRGSND